MTIPHKRFLFVAAMLLSAAISSGAQQKIYVSPQGSDDALGDEAHPLRTVMAAVEKARSISRETEVLLSEGEYCITSPVRLDKRDSNLQIKGAGIGKTVISGGVVLPPFQNADDGLWMMDLSEFLPLGGDVQQLFVNDRRAVLARTPNGTDCFATSGIKETVIDTIKSWSIAKQGFGIQKLFLQDEAALALKGLPPMPEKMKANFYHGWDITKRTVCSIDGDGRAISVSGGLQKAWNSMQNCSQFVLEDDFAFLDEPGEWYFDDRARQLWYMPRDGEDISSAQAIAPSLRQLLIVSGTEDEHVRNISIDGVSFQYSAFTYTWRGYGPEQAAASSDAAVTVDFADGFTMSNCEIFHTGNNGIWIRNACRDCGLSHSIIHDLGIGAVKIGSGTIPEDEDALLTRRITISDNILSGGGRILPTGEGVLLIHASDCSVVHNEISDFFYTGISVGWVWGYTHSPSKRNDISYNHIHHIGWGLLSDMGGIYTLGLSEGTTCRGNTIHHIYAYGYGGWGLYTDEGSSGVLMEDNLVYGCKSAGFHQHYGEGNIIRNNIFAGQLNEQMAATRMEDHLSFTFSGNIVYYETGDMFSHNWKGVKFEAYDNLYWNASGPVSFNGQTLAEWQSSTGKDKGSIVADPGFVNIGSGDFTMRNRKALRKIGFKAFDWTQAGVRGDAAWKAAARLDPIREAEFDSVVSKYLEKPSLAN